MSSLLLLNGSPRGPRSNSMKMLYHLAQGWEQAGGEAPTVLHLVKRSDFERAVDLFGQADCVMLGMPLYTDSMPSIVMAYFERLSDRVGRVDNPRLAFLVQSGFEEALHSRPLERFLAKLAGRLGSQYAGTVVRAGGEALQVMPDEANAKLWARLAELGGQLARDGEFDPDSLRRVAGMERVAPWAAGAVGLAMRLPIAQFYWNSQLKKNGVWERRFDAPYAERRA